MTVASPESLARAANVHSGRHSIRRQADGVPPNSFARRQKQISRTRLQTWLASCFAREDNSREVSMRWCCHWSLRLPRRRRAPTRSWLKGGGRLVGDVIVEAAPTRSCSRSGRGRVTLPLSSVDRIVSSTVALAEYRERAAPLSRATSPAGWRSAVWAELKDLRTQSREAWRHVLAADPGNADRPHGPRRRPPQRPLAGLRVRPSRAGPRRTTTAPG